MQRLRKSKIFMIMAVVQIIIWNMTTAAPYVLAGQDTSELPETLTMQDIQEAEEILTEPENVPTSGLELQLPEAYETESETHLPDMYETEPETVPESEPGTDVPKETESVLPTPDNEQTQHAEKETISEAETTEETSSEELATAPAESESQTDPIIKDASQEKPSGAKKLSKLEISRVEFDKNYIESDGYRLTNGGVTIYIDGLSAQSDMAEAYYIWTNEPDRLIPIEINKGSFVVDDEGKGDIQLVCIDIRGNVLTAQVKGIWIDKTIPEIEMGGEKDTIILMSPAALKVRVQDGDNGSGVISLSYKLDDEDIVIADAQEFELYFEESGEYTISVFATDMAGNQSRITKKIMVHAAPIITVTLPTDVTLMVLSRPVEDGVNIFSQDWEVINRSNVPIRATITEYGMRSDFDGDFAESYLNLKMQYRNQENEIPLGFAQQTNICDFTLGKALYTSDNQYISSGDDSRIRFSYRGYAADELNQYLKYHKAVFHMAFVFEPIIDES